jgi:hypothetical protein
LDALAAYLRYLEGTGNASWQEYVWLTNFFLQSNYKYYIIHIHGVLSLEMLPRSPLYFSFYAFNAVFIADLI